MKKMFHYLLAVSILMSMNVSNAKNNQRVTVNEKEFTVSIHKKDIIKRIKTLAAQISKDYAGKKPIFVGVLNGAFIFLSDLVREVDLECEIDFIQIVSYGNATSSSGEITVLKDLGCDITDRDVIIVEDIIDSGLSIQFAKELISKANPRSIRIVALLHKNLVKLDFPIDYIGFEIKPEFVIGYGLDYAQAARNLKSIYRLT